MALRAIDGTTLTVTMDILDDQDSPVLPKPGYPKVVLLDQDRSVIAQFSANPGSTVGKWESVVQLPLIGVTRPTEYKVRWRCWGQDGEKYQLSDTLTIDPKADRRDSEVVVFETDSIADFVMPLAVDPAMGASYQIYHHNQPMFDAWVPFSDPSIEVDAGLDRSVIRIPTVDTGILPPALFANLLSVRATVQGRPRSWQYKYWCITPQIALQMSMIEDFLNKSRIENVIPELEYSSGDLVGYLERGLNMFNSIHTITAFDGTNMQGPLFDSHLICSMYWALGAQLMAEGSLAFDFSGQGISLNVDRTPQLDAALGRIEARIQDTVVPLKKMLASQGILAGNGAAGAGTLRNPYNAGTLSLINAATTRVNGFSNYIGMRSRS
jgi:hypothetical protein